MARMLDAIVIGAGSNGLAAATTLGKAGRQVLALDAAESIGGVSRSIEFAPGFRASPLGLDTGWLPPAVARAMGMGIGDLGDIEPSVGVTIATGNGEPLALSCDPRQASERIRRLSPQDADRWPTFVARLRSLAGFLEAMYQLPPPDLDADLSFGEIAPLLGLGRKFRSLGRADMTELLRVLPMSVQDLVDEWFDHETVKAAVAAGGVRDLRQGPRSGGTAFVLLHHLVGAAAGSVRARPWWRGGPDAFAEAAEAAARRHGDGHVDRTERPFVTLDPASSTDLDQAFAIEAPGRDLLLHYAIADVAWFVGEGGACLADLSAVALAKEETWNHDQST